MGQLFNDLGFLRFYYRKLLIYGLLGGGFMLILGGFLAAEAIAAAGGSMPLTAGGRLYAVCILACLVLGGLAGLINWQLTVRGLTLHYARNLAVDQLLLGAMVNSEGTYRDRPGYGYGYAGTPQAPPVVQRVKWFVKRYEALCRKIELVPYPWDTDRGAWVVRNVVSGLMVVLLGAAVILCVLPGIVQLDLSGYFAEGRWIPALGTILLVWYGLEMMFHSLARHLLARMVQDTLVANPREFSALLEA